MSKPLLKVEDLTIQFEQQNLAAVNQISFEISRGECVALVGESGSGKSISALSLLGLLPKSAIIKSSSIQFDGIELANADERTLRGLRGSRVGYIFQEPMTSLNPLHTIEKQISETLALHRGITGKAAQRRIVELLELVGLRDAASRLKSYPHELSGGQRQRVMIAMALANEPELLIADEPTTALDVTIQQQILELLADLQKRLGMAVLMITHDLNIVRRFADRVYVMRSGEIVESNETLQLFDHATHPYTQELIDAEPQGSPGPIKPDANKLLEASKSRVWFPKTGGLFKAVYDHIRAVTDVDVEIKCGETLGIVGESGSGKSTLALALLRLIKSEGTMKLNGADIHHFNQQQMRPLRKNIQIVFQDPFGSLSPRMTIEEIVAEGLEVQGIINATEREQRVIEALEDVQIDPRFRGRYPHEFSGGQLQRIAIARALVLRPKLIVLDEPTSALDRTIQKQVIDLLRGLQSKYGLSYLFISHDLAVIKAISHRVMVMRQGELIESGSTEQIFNSPKSAYTKELIAASGLEKGSLEP